MAELESSPTGPESPPEPPDALTRTAALRQAWLWWLLFLLAPFVLFLGALLVIGASEREPSPTLGNTFFMVSLLWLITVPGAFALRSYCFRAYFEGRPVEPRSYLRGMVTVWLSMEIGGLLALIGCLVSNTLMPCLLPAAVYFVLFTPFWPSGHAMEETTGREDDEQLFHYPR